MLSVCIFSSLNFCPYDAIYFSKYSFKSPILFHSESSSNLLYFVAEKFLVVFNYVFFMQLVSCYILTPNICCWHYDNFSIGNILFM